MSPIFIFICVLGIISIVLSMSFIALGYDFPASSKEFTNHTGKYFYKADGQEMVIIKDNQAVTKQDFIFWSTLKGASIAFAIVFIIGMIAAYEKN